MAAIEMMSLTKENPVNDVIITVISLSHVYLWWIIEHSSYERMLNSHYESVDLGGSYLTIIHDCACL